MQLNSNSATAIMILVLGDGRRRVRLLSLVKVKSFLQYKYDVEKLNINEIMALTMSSRQTVMAQLQAFKMPIRENDKQLGPSRFGQKKANLCILFKGKWGSLIT